MNSFLPDAATNTKLALPNHGLSSEVDVTNIHIHGQT